MSYPPPPQEPPSEPSEGPPDPPDAALPGPPVPPPDGAQGRTTRGLLIALGVLVALVAVGGVVYLFTDESDDETELTAHEACSTSTTSAAESAPATDESSTVSTSPTPTTQPPPVTSPPNDPGEPSAPSDLPAGGPEETVVQFFTAAVIDRDCETVLDMVTANSIDWFGDSRAERLSTCEDTIMETQGEASLESTSLAFETAIQAEVETTVVEDGEPSTDSVTLRWEDDRWKVDIDA